MCNGANCDCYCVTVTQYVSKSDAEVAQLVEGKESAVALTVTITV